MLPGLNTQHTRAPDLSRHNSFIFCMQISFFGSSEGTLLGYQVFSIKYLVNGIKYLVSSIQSSVSSISAATTLPVRARSRFQSDETPYQGKNYVSTTKHRHTIQSTTYHSRAMTRPTRARSMPLQYCFKYTIRKSLVSTS